MKTKLICLLIVLSGCLFSGKPLYAQNYSKTIPQQLVPIDPTTFEKLFFELGLPEQQIQKSVYSGKPALVYFYYNCRLTDSVNKSLSEVLNKHPEYMSGLTIYHADIIKYPAFQQFSKRIPLFLFAYPGKSFSVAIGTDLSLERASKILRRASTGEEIEIENLDK